MDRQCDGQLWKMISRAPTTKNLKSTNALAQNCLSMQFTRIFVYDNTIYFTLELH